MSSTESKHVCPWWLGYLLVSPLRRLTQDPRKILSPHVREGMTVLEPGPGMGFFTLELARLVGPKGRVIAIDVQPKMLAALTKRAKRAALQDRIEVRRASQEDMGTGDLAARVDFVLAFALVHELPDARHFFDAMVRVLRSGGRMLLSEPAGHVNADEWNETVRAAQAAGFRPVQSLAIRQSRSMLLERPSGV